MVELGDCRYWVERQQCALSRSRHERPSVHFCPSSDRSRVALACPNDYASMRITPHSPRQRSGQASRGLSPLRSFLGSPRKKAIQLTRCLQHFDGEWMLVLGGREPSVTETVAESRV